ncbi:hypothetical protein [Polaribacter glomeratus]|uniref:hypothetical protein n=1 Tax=Polaribacter glomeratus TaxID=102 RepID=UPI0011B0EAD2|nr:hypothetical protein [Polaribacter glomeratus]TXD64731.1 hypothetical protein ESX12_13005 [Polaribacter glomeratus]
MLSIIKTNTPPKILKERVVEMVNLPYYECVVLFIDNKLSVIVKLWQSTRHYVCKSVAQERVIIDETLRGKSLGNSFYLDRRAGKKYRLRSH